MNRISEATGVERAWEEAAYIAALTVYLMEHKSDHETDAEIAEWLEERPFFTNLVIDVLHVMA